MPSIYKTNIMIMFKYFIALLICLGTTEAFAILPDTVYVRKPEDLGLKYRELNVTTKDGYRIATWFFPAQAQQAANRQGKPVQRPTIIICNGDAGNMSYFQLHLAQAWTAEGFNVATFDWRGFGKSSPFPMDKNYLCYTEMLEDYRAVVQCVAQQPETDKKAVIAMGWSTGAYMSMMTAYRNKAVKGFIGRSLLTDFEDTIPLIMKVKGKTREQLIVPQDFPVHQMPVHIAKRFKKPVFLINGANDKRTPLWMSEKILDLLPEKTPRELMVVPNAAHGDMEDPLLIDFDNFIRKSSAFIRTCFQ